jgi:solute carrier family 25 protein 39/40
MAARPIVPVPVPAVRSDVGSRSSNVVSSSLLSRIISGTTGSIVYALVGTPIEVVKVRQQSAPLLEDSFSSTLRRHGNPVKKLLRSRGAIMLNNGLMLPMDAFQCLVAPGGAASKMDYSIYSRLFESCRTTSSIVQEHSSGTFRMLKNIFRNEGLAGLYAGLKPTLAMSIPNTVIYLSSYDEISIRLHAFHSSNNPDADGSRAYIPLLAGSTARLISSFATAPLELIRTRQASIIAGSNTAQGRATGSIMEEFHLLMRTGGLMSCYNGLGPLLLRDAPFAAIYFLCLEKFRGSLSLGQWNGRHNTEQGIQVPASIDVMHTFAAGASAALVATTLTGPFDVVKTMRQVSNHAAGSNVNTLSLIRQIFHDEGIKGLWRGNVSRMIKVVPGHALMITCYEFGKKVFDGVL